MQIFTTLLQGLIAGKGTGPVKPLPPTDSADIFRFFDLPPEIRDRIYALLVTEPLCPTKPNWPVTPKCLFDPNARSCRYQTPMIAPVVYDCILQSPNWRFYDEARATFFRLRTLSVVLREQSHPAFHSKGHLQFCTDSSGSTRETVVIWEGLAYTQFWDPTLLAKVKASYGDLVRFREARFETRIGVDLERATSMMWTLQRAMGFVTSYPREKRSWSMYIDVNVARLAVETDLCTSHSVTKRNNVIRVTRQFHEFMRRLLTLAEEENVDMWVRCELALYQRACFYPPSAEKELEHMEVIEKTMAFFEEQNFVAQFADDEDTMPSWMKLMKLTSDQMASQKAGTALTFHFAAGKRYQLSFPNHVAFKTMGNSVITYPSSVHHSSSQSIALHGTS